MQRAELPRLRAVLRTFAEITGLNLVIDPDVKGIVDVSLHEVPWDQALDIILKANRLGYVADGTVILGGRRQVAESQEVGYLESPTGTVQGALEEFLEGTFPRLANRPIHYRWAGTMGFTSDGLPVLGHVDHAPGALYAVGFSGHGMSLGFAVGRHLARRLCSEDAGEEVEELFP